MKNPQEATDPGNTVLVSARCFKESLFLERTNNESMLGVRSSKSRWLVIGIEYLQSLIVSPVSNELVTGWHSP